MSEASLNALAPEFSGIAPDPRRFRMTLTIVSTDAWAEHGWGGQEVSIGEAILRVTASLPGAALCHQLPGTRSQAPLMRAFCMRWSGSAATATSTSASGVTSSARAVFTFGDQVTWTETWDRFSRGLTGPSTSVGRAGMQTRLSWSADRDGAVDRHRVTEQVKHRAVLVHRRGQLLVALRGFRPGDANLHPDG